MKAASFAYHRPDSVADAVGLLGEYGDEAKILAGGQSLVPMLNMRLTAFPAIVDIGRVTALRDVQANDIGVTVGATARQCDVEGNRELGRIVPLLVKATPFIGHFQIRSRGTVGGSVAHADPAAEYPAVALALDAEVELARAGGRRVVPAREFFAGIWTTVTEPDEVLTAMRFPSWGADAGFAVDEVARRHGDFALAGACAGVRLSGGAIDRVTISFFGLGSTPVRADEAERVLVGRTPDEVDVDEIGALAVADLDPPTDLHASGALRRRIGATVAARALRTAMEEATAHE